MKIGIISNSQFICSSPERKWSQFRKKKKKRNKKRKQEIWYLWQIRTAVKYIQILRQHTTHRKKHQVLFATTRKSNKKLTHFLKEAFLFMLFFFLNPPQQNIWRHFLFSFCVHICKSSRLFYVLYKNLSFKTGIAGFGECYRYIFFIVFFVLFVLKFENERKAWFFF